MLPCVYPKNGHIWGKCIGNKGKYSSTMEHGASGYVYTWIDTHRDRDTSRK